MSAKHLPVYKEATRLVGHLYATTKKAPRELRHTLGKHLWYHNSNTINGAVMKINSLPSVDFLRECFDYLPDGKLVWKDRPASHFSRPATHKRHMRCVAGKEAGTIDAKGYKVVMLTYNRKNRVYRVHRIVYALHYGDTDLHIDHINHDRSDNRIENLRACSPSTNIANLKPNDSGRLRGAVYDKRKRRWAAYIKVNYRQRFLGRYDTEQEAHQAYMNAKRQYRPELFAGETS